MCLKRELKENTHFCLLQSLRVEAAKRDSPVGLIGHWAKGQRSGGHCKRSGFSDYAPQWYKLKKELHCLEKQDDDSTKP